MYLVKDLKVWQGHGEVQLIPLVPIAVVALLQYLDLGKATLELKVRFFLKLQCLAKKLDFLSIFLIKWVFSAKVFEL